MKSTLVSPLSVCPPDTIIWDMLINTDKWVRAVTGDTIIIDEFITRGDELRLRYDASLIATAMPQVLKLLQWLLDQYEIFLMQDLEERWSRYKTRRSFRVWLLSSNAKTPLLDTVLSSLCENEEMDTKTMTQAVKIAHIYENYTH